MSKTAQPPGAVGLETPPHSCQPSTVRAAPLQTALGTSSGRDQRWGRPGALLSREEGQKLRKGGTNASPVDLELLPLGPRGPPSSGRARAPWRGRRQAGRGPGHPSLGAAGGHGVSAAQVEAGLRVRAGPDQELRHHRWGGGSLPQVPAGGGGPAQSSLAVSPRREEAEPEGSQHGPCLVPDKSSLAGRRGQPLGVWGPARRGCWQSRPWPGGVPSLQAGDGRAEDRVLLRPLALLVTW